MHSQCVTGGIMAKHLRKAVAVAAVSLFCLPLAACGGVATDNVDGVSGGVHGSGATYGYTDGSATLENSPVTESNGNGIASEAVAEDVPPAVASVDPPKSEEYDAYLWDGDLAKAGWGGGTVSAPSTYAVDSDPDKMTVTIGDAEAFAYFAHEASLVENDGFKGYTVNLECNIDLDNKLWLPVSFASRGNAAHESSDGKTVMFKGVFDGKGHTVYNFSSAAFREGMAFDGDNAIIRVSDTIAVPFPVDGTTECEYPYGLFATAGNATFKNLSVVDVNIDLREKEADGKTFVTDCVGTVVGYVAGDCTIENITVGSDKTNDAIDAEGVAGGIVGRVYAGKNGGKPYGKISAVDNVLPAGFSFGAVRALNCTNYINIGTPENIGAQRGGIVGYIVYHTVSEFDGCVNYGDLCGRYVGGMMSYFQLAGNVYKYADAPETVIEYRYTFENCVNRGDLTAVNTTAEGDACAGGMVGAIYDWLTSDSALFTKTYGFADCFNYGNISMSQVRGAGGIVGVCELRDNKKENSFTAWFNRVFNYGDVIGYSGDTDHANLGTGGIVGELVLPENIKDKITVAVGNCGAVSGKNADKTGGIVGSGKNYLDKATVVYAVDAYKPN